MRRAKNSTRVEITCTIIGALAWAALLGIILGGILSGCSSTPSVPWTWSWSGFIRWSLFGAFLGGIIGFAIGCQVEKKRD